MGPEDAFWEGLCGAVRKDLGVPLRVEGPTWTMRGVPVPSLWHLHDSWRIWRGCRPGRSAGGRGSGYGGDRRPPVTGPPCAAAAASAGLASEGRGELPPARRDPRVNPGRLRRVTLAVHSCSTARARPHWSRPGPSGLARRRCALEAVEKVVTAGTRQHTTADGVSGSA